MYLSYNIHSAGHTLEYTSLFHCSRAAEGDWVLWSSGRQICVSCGKRCQGSRFFRPCCCWAWGLSMSCWIWVCCRTTSEQRRCLWCTPKKTPNNERSSGCFCNCETMWLLLWQWIWWSWNGSKRLLSVLFTALNMCYCTFLLTILMGSTGPMLFTYTAVSITVGLTRI